MAATACCKPEGYRMYSGTSNSGWLGQLVEDFKIVQHGLAVATDLWLWSVCSGNALCPRARPLW